MTSMPIDLVELAAATGIGMVITGVTWAVAGWYWRRQIERVRLEERAVAKASLDVVREVARERPEKN